MQVCFQYATQPGLFVVLDFRKPYKIAVNYFVGFAAENVGQAASHAGAEIEAERAEDKHDTAGHVFAAVLANPFNDRKSAAIADGKALAGAACHEEPAGCGAVENCVARQDVPAAGGGRARGDGDGSTRETFAHVVVCFSGKRQSDAFGQKCAEALASAAVEFLDDFLRDGMALTAGTAAAHQLSA